METRRHETRTGRLVLLAAALVALLAISPAAVHAAAEADPQYPAEGCSDANIDCGTGESETGVITEFWSAYEYSPGTCRTRWSRATRRNLAHMIVFRYNEQVRWCYRNNVITYF